MNTDNRILKQYGIEWRESDLFLTDELIIVYCLHKDLPIPECFYKAPCEFLTDEEYNAIKRRDVGEDPDNPTQGLFDEFEVISKARKNYSYHTDDKVLTSLLKKSSLFSHEYRTYNEMIERIENTDAEVFQKDYPTIIVSLIQASSTFRYDEDGPSFGRSQYSFHVASALSCLIKSIKPTSVEEYCVSSCFTGALLPSNIKFLPFGAESDEYRYFPLLRDTFCPGEDEEIEENPYEEEAAVICGNTDYERLISRCELSGDVRFIIFPFAELFEKGSDIAIGAVNCGYASKIITVHSASNVTERILILDLWNNEASVSFEEYDEFTNCLKPDSSLANHIISYEEIADKGFYLAPNYYVKSVLKDGEIHKTLGEICEIDHAIRLEKGKSPLDSVEDLPYYEYSSDFSKIIYNSKHPKIETYRYGYLTSAFLGPHVHITAFPGLKVEAIVTHTSDKYHCASKKSFALRIKDDSINPEYLAYVLSNDQAFSLEFLTDDIDALHLLKYQVAIIPDRQLQDAFIGQLINDNSEVVVKSDARYRIACIENNDYPIITPDSKKNLNKWLIDLEHSFPRVKDFLEKYELVKDTFDAVIMDADIDSEGVFYKGLRSIYNLCRKYDKPLFVYTDSCWERIEGPLTEDEISYLNNRIFCSKNEQRFTQLFTCLREELDDIGIPSAVIANKYYREFEAARWIDERHPDFHIESSLRFILSQPNDSHNQMRGILRNLLKIVVDGISLGSGLENVDRGAIPELLFKGYYLDKNKTHKTYTLVDDVMPNALAFSLYYASTILNGGSHTEVASEGNSLIDVYGYVSSSHSQHLSESVISIVMDFMLWIKSTEETFNGYCTSKNEGEKQKVNWEGFITMVNKKEYFCTIDDGTKIHLFVDVNRFKFIEGIKAKIFFVSEEGSKLRNKYKYFAASGDWGIIEG